MVQTPDGNVDDPGTRRGGLRLLVVDDNRDAADSLSMVLSCWGHRPRVAYDGPGAVRLARAEAPDAVLLDLALPGRDGYQVAGDLRGDGGLTDVPFIAVTGFTDGTHRARAREAGFAHFLVKPLDLEVLQRLLEDMRDVRVLADRKGDSGYESDS